MSVNIFNFKSNSSRWLLFTLILVLISTGCVKKPEPAVYPNILTLPATDIGPEGATLNVDLLKMGNQEIIEFGFTWSDGSNPDIIIDDRISIDIPSQTGRYSTRISSALAANKPYYVRSYIRTTEYLVYGNEVRFDSKGSLAPVITGFSPDSAGWGDTLTIRGLNYSYNKYNNQVFLGNMNCSVIGASDTIIKVLVPNTLTTLDNDIRIEVSENISNTLPKKFKLLKPLLRDYQPRKVYWGDTLIIKGRKLKYAAILNNKVQLSNIVCQVNKIYSDSCIAIIVPFNIESVSNPLKLSIFGFVLNGSEPVELLSPYFNFNPKEGLYGTSVTLEGRFNTTVAGNKVFFGTIPATISSVTTTKMVIKFPETATQLESNIIYQVKPFTVTSTETFRLLSPVITSISPATAAMGETLTITGSNLVPAMGTLSVKIGSYSATIISSTPDQIEVRVPISGTLTPVPVTVISGPVTVVSGDNFTFQPTSINSINPKTASFENSITLSLSNFNPIAGLPVIKIGSNTAQIESLDKDQIIIKVPNLADSIPVPVTFSLGGVNITSSDLFTLKPPEINTVSYSQFNFGSTVEITGTGFNPQTDLNKVYIDNTSLSVVSVTSESLTAMISNSLPRNLNRLVLEVGKYKRFYIMNSVNTEAFASIAMPQNFFTNYILNANRKNGLSFGLNGKGYVFDVVTATMSSYEPSTNKVVKLSYVARLTQAGATIILNQDSAFVIGNNYFEYYKPSTDEWKYFGPGPSNYLYGGGFSIGGRVYYGLFRGPSATTFSATFQVYNKSQGRWVNKASFPSVENTYVAASFAHNGIGYILFANKKLYSYNPATDTWKALSLWPAEGTTRYGPSTFIINNKIYIGLGYSYNTDKSYNDIWTYDPVSDGWTLVSSMPNVGRSSAVTFVVNQKAYIGYGTTPSKSLTDFYEFDPSFLK